MRRAIPVQVGPVNIQLLDIEGRPWVAVEPLCISIGVDAAAQRRRLARHQAGGRIDIADAAFPDVSYTAVALEDLSFFLRTLRPQREDARALVKQIAPCACPALWWHWFRHVGTYMNARALRDKLGATLPIVRTPPPPPRTRLCIEDAERMRHLREDGHTLSQISRATGFGVSTVSEVLNGKYPIMLKHRRDLHSETCRTHPDDANARNQGQGSGSPPRAAEKAAEAIPVCGDRQGSADHV